MPDYQILVAYGHSAAKALEIYLDAQRGEVFSIKYIKMLRNLIENRKIKGDR